MESPSLPIAGEIVWLIGAVAWFSYPSRAGQSEFGLSARPARFPKA